MRKKSDNAVVLNMRGPGSRPKALAEAFAEYDEPCNASAACIGERRDARAAIPKAKDSDVLAFAERLRKDPDAQPTRELEEAAKAKLAALEHKQAALDVNADEAGDRLVVAIVAGRDEWAETLRAEEAKAREELRAALAAARPALEALATARGGAEWVEAFDEGQARRGELPLYNPRKSLTVDKRRARRQISANDDRLDAADLLALIEEVLDPPAPKRPYTSTARSERQLAHG